MTTVAMNRYADALRSPATAYVSESRCLIAKRVLQFMVIAIIVLPIKSDCGPHREAHVASAIQDQQGGDGASATMSRLRAATSETLTAAQESHLPASGKDHEFGPA